jgi:hypothetical protein
MNNTVAVLRIWIWIRLHLRHLSGCGLENYPVELDPDPTYYCGIFSVV